MSATPDFQTLSVDTIPTLSDKALAAAACAALDTLRDGPGSLEGALVLWIWQASDGLEATARHAIYGVQWRRLDRELLGLLQDRARV